MRRISSADTDRKTYRSILAGLAGLLVVALSACSERTEPLVPESASGGSMGGWQTGAIFGGASGQDETCGINIEKSEVVARMRTVGLVDFSTDFDRAQSATIEFGLDSTYGTTALAESTASGFSATLVGMKANTIYHYRVVISGPSGECIGSDQTIETGPTAQGIRGPTEKSTGPEAAPGFMVLSAGFQALILDKDGDVVWGVDLQDELSGSFIGVTSVKVSWDAKFVYARDLGPFDAATGGRVVRIPIEGGDAETIVLPGGHHHDFAVIPSGIAYIAKREAGKCDYILTAKPDGTRVQLLADLGKIFEHYPKAGFGQEACHVNAIEYYHDRQLFSVSDREKDVVAVFDTLGRPVTAIGQRPLDKLPITPVIAEGATTLWRVQHGHDFYADDKLVVFSNHEMGASESPVLHYTIKGNHAKLDWQYTDLPPSGTQGDADYLPNGNFLLTSSSGGEIHELSPARKLVGKYVFTGGVGYVDHRATLYGPP